MYHVSPASNLSSIMRSGLRPVDGWIYVSETPESAKDIAQDVVDGYGTHSIRTGDDPV